MSQHSQPSLMMPTPNLHVSFAVQLHGYLQSPTDSCPAVTQRVVNDNGKYSEKNRCNNIVSKQASSLFIKELTNTEHTLKEHDKNRRLAYIQIHTWRRGSVVRTSVFGWRTFPDLRLIYGSDHFVSKVSAIGQPTRPTQPFISSG